MRELSVAEQRYRAVLAVVGDGESVTEVAARLGVRRQSVHEWLPGVGHRARARLLPVAVPPRVIRTAVLAVIGGPWRLGVAPRV